MRRFIISHQKRYLFTYTGSSPIIVTRIFIIQKATQALGAIDLSKCIAYPSLETTQFIVANKDTGRDYILVAEQQSDRDEWLRVLDGVLPQPKKEALRVYLDDTSGDSQYCTVAILPRTTVSELYELVKSKLGNKPGSDTCQIYDDKKGSK